MKRVPLLFLFVLSIFIFPRWGGAITFHLIQSMSDEEYQAQMRSCEVEVEHLQDQTHEAWSRLREAQQSEHELRRELLLCWHEQDLLWFDLEACRASSSENENNNDAPSETESEEGGLSTERSNGPINYHFMIRMIDLAKNGTCEKPKTNNKREKCLSQCQMDVSYWREEFDYVQEKLSDPVGALREDIQNCREHNQNLQEDLDACRNGGGGDSGATVLPIDTSGTVRLPPITPPNGGGSGDPPPNPPPGCNEVNCKGR